MSNPFVNLMYTQLTTWAEIAKDSNVGVGDRASAAKDAVGNKLDETKHDVRLSLEPIMCFSHSSSSNYLLRNRQNRRVTSSPSKRTSLMAAWSSSWPSMHGTGVMAGGLDLLCRTRMGIWRSIVLYTKVSYLSYNIKYQCYLTYFSPAQVNFTNMFVP